MMMGSALLPIPVILHSTRLQSPKLGPCCLPKLPHVGSRLPISSSWKSEAPSPSLPSVSQSVAAIILGDVSGTRLYPLTKGRADGAIPLAANYRLIDIVVSNCINSNITKIYALTQFNSTSLNSHLSRAYSALGRDGFVEVLAACQNLDDQGWFQGNADAIRRCLCVLGEYPVEDFLVLPSHHLYRMEYEKLIKAHRDSHADISMVFSLSEGNGSTCDCKDRVITGGLESGQTPLMTMERLTRDESSQDLRSMGIYVIRKEALRKLLTEELPDANDLDSELIPGAISMGMKVQPHKFSGYWEEMRDVEAFYRASMEMTRRTSSGFNFYDRDRPIYTTPRCLQPTRTAEAAITDSVIGDGCVLNRCKIRGSVIGMRTWIGDGAVLEDAIVMGADVYQELRPYPARLNCTHSNRFKRIDDDFRWGMTMKQGRDVPIGIGEKTQIRRAIIDKNARIGKNVKIVNIDQVQESDREASGYVITSGIVVVLRGATIPDGSIL